MYEKPLRTKIRLELTKRQRQQIRQATGREVSTIELRLETLPELLEPPLPEEESSAP